MSTEEKKTWKHLLKSRLLLKPPVDDDPRLLPGRTKNVILGLLALCACTPGFSSTIYFPGLPMITQDLHAPPIATTLTAALFVLFMGIAPVFWASISDHYHVRRCLSIFSMLIFAVASLGLALMNNIWGLVVLRCVQSIGSSCGQSVGAGVIADCYPLEKRGAAFGKYFFGVFFGPLLGPILGGVLIMSKEGWRATFWFCLALGLFASLMVFFFLPETYRDNARFDASLPIAEKTDQTQQGVTQTTEDASSIADDEDGITISNSTPIKKARMNPLSSFFLLRHPFIFLASLVGGICFGSMFAVETIIPSLFEQKYSFNSWQTGLSYLGAGIGNLLGSIVGGRLSDQLLLRARKQRGRPMVEDRLTLNIWPCLVIIMPFGLLLFGWMVEYDRSVWAGIIGFGCVTFGMTQIMTSTSAYLVDATPGIGASVTAAANFVRMLIACVLTLASNPMVSALGAGYTTVMLAALAWFGAILLFILKIYGERLRQWSGFMS
ncbi:major facilitator superfamily domain-containing protein [Halteromyces radiatus]|uniref:major facilitator superfamily domain-containing protein n=1 Tax=Halteromyces radiatus TaxID=101107 RepID=UPI002220BC3E|nr:major facilitator superfamily domain-containing protein [Halteromyces radiatus]KAI8078881.1 major facilitator superfamily domain-containing protein [Halteromyces radiatus]